MKQANERLPSLRVQSTSTDCFTLNVVDAEGSSSISLSVADVHYLIEALRRLLDGVDSGVAPNLSAPIDL